MECFPHRGFSYFQPVVLWFLSNSDGKENTAVWYEMVAEPARCRTGGQSVFFGHQNGPSKRSRGLYGKPAGPRDSEGWRTVEISERPESPRVEMRAVWGPGSGTSRTSP